MMDYNQNVSIAKKGVNRATGIVIRDGKVLLMHRRNRGKEYYTFPGGGIGEGETSEEALVRELLEETSVSVTPQKLVYTITWDDETSELFHLSIFVSGETELSEGSIEKEVMLKNPEQFYEPLWMSLVEVQRVLLYPLEIKEWFLEDLKTGFLGEARNITLDRRMARQTMKSRKCDG